MRFPGRFPKRSHHWFPSILAISCIVPVLGAQSSSCRALVQYNHDLWFADNFGTLISRVSNDAREKLSASLAPDGKSVLFNLVDEPRIVHLVTVAGDVISEATASQKSGALFVEAVSWARQNVVQVEMAGSPSAHYFEFWKMSGTDLNGHTVIGTGVGRACALSPVTNDVACTEDFAIAVNERVIATINPFAGQPEETLRVSLGQSASTRTSPSVLIGVSPAPGGLLSVHVQAPDGPWHESTVPSGQMFMATVNQVLHGFVAVAQGADAAVSIFRSEHPERFLGPLAWSIDGSGLTALLGNQSTGTLATYAKPVDRADPMAWRRTAASEPLSVDEPIRSIQYASDNSLTIKTDTRMVAHALPSVMTGPENATTGLSKSRSRTLELRPKDGKESVRSTVFDWNCTPEARDH